MSRRLPPEIIDLIIDHLHDSHPELRICARVCKAWLESSRFHLFYSISITPQNQSYPSYHQLYQAIQRSPQIALHVRELSFARFSGPITQFFDVPFTQLSDGPTLGRILPWLLQSFIRLRKLEIMNTVWEFLTPNIRKAFRDILTLPSLVHFEAKFLFISHLEHLANLIQPHLKRLNVNFCLDGRSAFHTREFDKENEQDAATERQPCNLEHLTILGGPGFTGLLLEPRPLIDISNLRVLEIIVDDNGVRILKRLIRRSRLSLEYLAVMLRPRVAWSAPAIINAWEDPENDFGMPDLKMVYLVAPFDQRHALCVTYLLFNLTMPELRRIALILQFPPNDWSVDTDAEWRKWAEVDRVLCVQPLSLLNRVKVLLSGPESSAREMEERHRKFVEYFPFLVSRGAVEIGHRPS